MATYSQNWFEQLARTNFKNLKNIINIYEPINFLEIGCFEGNCHLWMYENVLINPRSRSSVVDPFGRGTGNSTHTDSYITFKNNLSKYLENINILVGYSNTILPILKNEIFDIIYVDGDHTAEQTYKDGILSWKLLKTGGIMIFDDYLWEGISSPNIGTENHPALGINRFLKEKQDKYELLGKEYGFEPECKILDLNSKYTKDSEIKFNYQIWIRKLLD